MKQKTFYYFGAAFFLVVLISCMHESTLKTPDSISSNSASINDDINGQLPSDKMIPESRNGTNKKDNIEERSGSLSAISLLPAYFSREKTDGEDEASAIFKAYRSRIDNIHYTDNEWVINLDGSPFYWLGGRLLPEDKKNQKSKFRPYGFYKYPDELPPINGKIEPEQLERIRRYSEAIKSHPRDNTFLETLYNGKTLDEILKHVKYISFLGYKIEVHESLIPQYSAIEREILSKAAVNSDVKKYLDSLGSVSAFNWRRIEDSISRSYHSFGIAVDLVPANIKGKEIYWNWTRVFNPQWYSVPYSKRWMVPDEIVKIFEKYGFIWGGKWLFYDNMHFEYRPEILILSGKKISRP
ncbi:MAG: M15 family metallopeptidase [Spirochaetia bacterium]|jgi:hypothetical protein|nr:M15 family metallopeptidase [Spirochaetia bacterium]